MTKLIAEVGTALGGSRDWIEQSVKRCAESGIWGYKIQLYTPQYIVTPDAPTYGNHDAIAEPPTQKEHFKNPFPLDQVEYTALLCRKYGLEFFASVFDESMVFEAMNRGKVNYFKLASADITHKPLIEAVASTGKDIFLSTGASTLPEIIRATQWIADASPDAENHKVVLMACSLSYPASSRDSKLDVLLWMAENMKPVHPGLEIGFSDHTEGVNVTADAVLIGADFIEKHVTITPGLGGDHDFAVSPEEFGSVLEKQPYLFSVAQVLEAREPHVLPAEEKARTYARRSICSAYRIQAGRRIRPQDLRILRPGTGMEPFLLDDHDRTPIGKTAAVDIPAFTPLTEDMFGNLTASLTVI